MADPIIRRKRYSESLKRVLAHKRQGEVTFEGFFMSNEQIIKLGKTLQNLKKKKGFGPDGMCFMVGKWADPEGNIFKSVEVVPFIMDENSALKFYQQDGVIGKFDTIELGKPSENGAKFSMDGDGYGTEWERLLILAGSDVPAGPADPDVQAGPTTPTQRTPPPFSA